jgi:hypothetical protein
MNSHLNRNHSSASVACRIAMIKAKKLYSSLQTRSHWSFSTGRGRPICYQC